MIMNEDGVLILADGGLHLSEAARVHARKQKEAARDLPRLLTDRTLRGGGVLAVRATAPASSS